MVLRDSKAAQKVSRLLRRVWLQPLSLGVAVQGTICVFFCTVYASSLYRSVFRGSGISALLHRIFFIVQDVEDSTGDEEHYNIEGINKGRIGVLCIRSEQVEASFLLVPPVSAGTFDLQD
jgi:hypothetical protein